MMKKLFPLAILIPVLAGLLIYNSQKPRKEYMDIVYTHGDPFALSGTTVRPSEFSTTLNQSLTESHAGTTLKVSSITTKDDQTLNAGILGDLIVLKINAGKSNSEIVKCTSLTVATKTFSGCTFGMSFTGENTSVAANIKAHSPGEPVIISNDDLFLSQQYAAIDAPATITGLWTVSTTTSNDNTSRLIFGQDGAYIFFDEDTGNLGFASTTAGSQFVFNTTGTSFTAVSPLSLSGGELKLATSTYTFVLNNSRLGIATSTISGGTASGKKLDDFWNDRWNATTTIPALSFTNATSSRNFVVGGNPTWPNGSTGLFVTGRATSTVAIATEEWCDITDGCQSSLGNWSQLGETIMSAAGSATTTIAARKDLLIYIAVTGHAGSENLILSFNGDRAANYGWTNSNNSGAATTANTDTKIIIKNNNSVEPTSCFVRVTNLAATRKLVAFECVEAPDSGTPANASIIYEGSAVWNNTSAQITSVSLGSNGGQNISANSRITIYGAKD